MTHQTVVLDYVTSIGTDDPAHGPGWSNEGVQPQVRRVRLGENDLWLRLDRRGRLYDGTLSAIEPTRHLVFAEVSPLKEITGLHIPTVGHVLWLNTTVSGDTEIQLDSSAAPFVLRATSLNRARFLEILEDALASRNSLDPLEPVHHVAIVHVSTSHDVVYVDRAKVVVDTGQTARLAPRPARAVLGEVSTVSTVVLDEFVRSMRAATCQVPGLVGSCIPFTLAFDGCWARAHEMCDRLADATINAAKLWIYAPPGERLRARTRNVSTCETDWFFHVAPIVRVSGRGLFVIDPSLFPDTAVPRRQWVECMNQIRPIFRVTDREVYTQVVPDQPQPIGPSDDPGVATVDRNESDLIHLRCRLNLLTIDPLGPPPYQYCPI